MVAWKLEKPEDWRPFVVLVASFFCQLINDGFLYGADLLPPVLARYFDRSDGEILVLVSLLQAPQYLCGPVSGYLTNRFGPRRIVMTFATCAGISFYLASFFKDFTAVLVMSGFTGVSLGLYSVPKVTAVTFHFNAEWRTFATTVTTVGAALGSALFPFIFQSMLRVNTWQITFVYLSCILLQCVVLGAFMRSPSGKIVENDMPRADIEMVPTTSNHLRIPLEDLPDPEEEEAPRKKRFSLRTIAFPCFLIQLFLWTFAEWADVIFPLWMTTEGRSGFQIAVLITITTSSSVLGRIIASSITLISKKRLILCCNIVLLFMALSNYCLTLCESFWEFVIGKGVQGLIFGTASGFVPGIILELVDLDRFNSATGNTNFIVGMAGIISPPLSGVFVDTFGSYRLLYKCISGLILVSVFLMVPFHWPFSNYLSKHGSHATGKRAKAALMEKAEEATRPNT